MIYGRGKCFYRMLGLAACNAARRFASRRVHTRGRKGAWRPMVLRWRQKRRKFGNVLADRTAPYSQVSWFPQFHFHFASYTSDRTQPVPTHRLSPVVDSRQERVVMDHRWTNTPTATPPLQVNNAKQPLREIYERRSSPSKEHGSMPPTPRVMGPRNGSLSKKHGPVTPAPRVRWLPNNSPSKEHVPMTPTLRVWWPRNSSQLKEHGPVPLGPRAWWLPSSSRSKENGPMTPTLRVWWPRNSSRSKQQGSITPTPRVWWLPSSSRSKEQGPMTPTAHVWWPRNSSRSKEQGPMTSTPRVWWLLNSSPSKEHGPVTPTPRISWLPCTQQLVAWPTPRLRHESFGRLPEGRLRMPRERQTQFLQTRSQIWQHWHQVFFLRQPKSSDPVSYRASGKKTLQFQYERPEELVWRPVLRTPLNSDGEKRGLDLSKSISRTQVRSQPVNEPVGVAPLLERAAATQVTKLDPGVLDRLTDEVIRRVDQRMRIERQRRGI